MEEYARGISIDMKLALDVYTGVYGIQKQIHRKKKTEVSVYLDMRIKNKYKVEVPLIVWKLLVDLLSQSAIAFLVSNKPNMTDEEKARFVTICKSVCNELGDEFKPDYYIVCCTYEDFIRHIKFLPVQLRNPKLLKNTVPLAKRSVPIRSAGSSTSAGAVTSVLTEAQSTATSHAIVTEKAKRTDATKTDLKKDADAKEDISLEQHSPVGSVSKLHESPTQPKPQIEVTSKAAATSTVDSSSPKELTPIQNEEKSEVKVKQMSDANKDVQSSSLDSTNFLTRDSLF